MEKNINSGGEAKRVDEQNRQAGLLRPGFSPLGIWAFSIGTSIGWGSFIVTCNTYLQKSGLLGTVFGLLLGMAVILVITWNLQYMIRCLPDAGGIYSFEKRVNGKDFGFLAAWFVLLTYLAILWANITSLPLFARFFLGDAFRFGFHYAIFGYEVWLGEALLSICALVLVGLLCSRSLRIPHAVVIAGALVFAAGFTLCAVLALVKHDGAYSYEPLYTEGSNAFAQIVRIAAISPWAFIGFENISHFSEEYRFPLKKVRGILLWSVLVTTLLYLFVSLLSVSAYPPEYDSWLAYIRDMGNLEGIKAVPAFYAAEHYLGQTGVTILMFSLFGVIVTSLIGNLLAVSRLLYAAGRDGDAPRALAALKGGIPCKAVYAVVAVSLLIPFLGRTAIGWIVDVTTLGATLIYGLISHAVYRQAKKEGLRLEARTGMAGIVLMVIFLLLLLIPGLLPFDAMETESYILFIVWALLGLAYFRRLIRQDEKHEYGQRVVVWVILLMLVLFASMMWVSRKTEAAANEAVGRIFEYHQSHPEHDSDAAKTLERELFLQEQANQISSVNTLYSLVSLGLFLLSTTIMLNNYEDARKLGQRLSAAEQTATKDALTGVKNRTSYAQYEREFNERIADDVIVDFALALCDINDLKTVNDTLGHAAGDECIRSNCMLICKTFKHCPVFRLGGDEFAVFLRGEDYNRREELLEQLRSQLDEGKAGASMSIGLSEFVRGQDKTFHDVLSRADALMYEEKKAYKARHGAR